MYPLTNQAKSLTVQNAYRMTTTATYTDHYNHTVRLESQFLNNEYTSQYCTLTDATNSIPSLLHLVCTD